MSAELDELIASLDDLLAKIAANPAFSDEDHAKYASEGAIIREKLIANPDNEQLQMGSSMFIEILSIAADQVPPTV